MPAERDGRDHTSGGDGGQRLLECSVPFQVEFWSSFPTWVSSTIQFMSRCGSRIKRQAAYRAVSGTGSLNPGLARCHLKTQRLGSNRPFACGRTEREETDLIGKFFRKDPIISQGPRRKDRETRVLAVSKIPPSVCFWGVFGERGDN